MLFRRVRISDFFHGVPGVQPVLGSLTFCSKADRELVSLDSLVLGIGEL